MQNILSGERLFSDLITMTGSKMHLFLLVAASAAALAAGTPLSGEGLDK